MFVVTITYTWASNNLNPPHLVPTKHETLIALVITVISLLNCSHERKIKTSVTKNHVHL